jgi:hypothetical protein
MKKYDQFHKNLTIPILRAKNPCYIVISLCIAGSVVAAFFEGGLIWSQLALFIAGYMTIGYLYKRKFLRQIVIVFKCYLIDNSSAFRRTSSIAE